MPRDLPPANRARRGSHYADANLLTRTRRRQLSNASLQTAACRCQPPYLPTRARPARSNRRGPSTQPSRPREKWPKTRIRDRIAGNVRATHAAPDVTFPNTDLFDQPYLASVDRKEVTVERPNPSLFARGANRVHSEATLPLYCNRHAFPIPLTISVTDSNGRQSFLSRRIEPPYLSKSLFLEKHPIPIYSAKTVSDRIAAMDRNSITGPHRYCSVVQQT